MEGHSIRTASLAHWLDARFVVPGTRIRFGWDPILGLLPVAGDTVALVVSCAVLFEARARRAPWRVLLPMAGNILLDYGVGLVPIAGDLFDAWFKANLRNVAILQRWMDEGRG